MEVNYKLLNKNLIVHVGEELDHYEADKIKKLTEKMMKRGTVKNIIFHFGNTNFMDSSGVGLIIGRYKALQNTGGKLVVTELKPSVEKLFELSGLLKLVYTCPNLDMAVHFV